MPDIALCFGEKCPQKETCYRYKATPCKYRQSYGAFDSNLNKGHCDYYVPVEKMV